MRKLIVFKLAAGSVAMAVSAAAQDEPPGSHGSMPDAHASMSAAELAPDQQMQYDAWSAQEKSTYNNWGPDHQAYFWTLPPQRQTIYWRLSEADRATIAAMSEPDRETAWMRVESRVAQQADKSASTADSGEAAPPPPEGDPTEDPPMM